MMMNERINMPEKAYIAYAIDELPEVGKKYHCTRIQYDLHQRKFIEYPCLTSTVTEFGYLADDTYLLKTKNTYYVVKNTKMPETNIKFAELYEDELEKV